MSYMYLRPLLETAGNFLHMSVYNCTHMYMFSSLVQYNWTVDYLTPYYGSLDFGLCLYIEHIVFESVFSQV